MHEPRRAQDHRTALPLPHLAAHTVMLPPLTCRVELAQMLCSSLPLPYDYSGLLCETLFAQLLRLPAPRLSPVAFSALIAHAALLRPGFPKYLAGSVRQLYLRLQFLAPELSLRLADVLAHFITNMNFRCAVLVDRNGQGRHWRAPVRHRVVGDCGWPDIRQLRPTAISSTKQCTFAVALVCLLASAASPVWLACCSLRAAQP